METCVKYVHVGLSRAVKTVLLLIKLQVYRIYQVLEKEGLDSMFAVHGKS